MTEVYAVFTTDFNDYYARPALDKIFAAKADAEAYAQTLRERMSTLVLFWGEEPESMYASVTVRLIGIH